MHLSKYSPTYNNNTEDDDSTKPLHKWQVEQTNENECKLAFMSNLMPEEEKKFDRNYYEKQAINPGCGR